MSISIGFTGTRAGMNAKQTASFIRLLRLFDEDSKFHHGDCIGADAGAFSIVHDLTPHVTTVAHPCSLEEQRAYTKSDRVLQPKPPIARNHDIVDMVDILIAAPRTLKEEQGSGTWATIRYARDVYKPLIILDP